LMYRVGGALEAALIDKWGGSLLAKIPALESALAAGSVA
jgi:hypothetical protein